MLELNNPSIGVEFILLCFDREDPMNCHRYESPNNPIITNDIAKTTIERNAIQLGNYKGQPIAVGGWATRTGDLMSFEEDSYVWSPITDFPCYFQDCPKNDFIYWYASVSTTNSYIIMGGTITGDDEKRDGIVEFKDDVWARDNI